MLWLLCSFYFLNNMALIIFIFRSLMTWIYLLLNCGFYQRVDMEATMGNYNFLYLRTLFATELVYACFGTFESINQHVHCCCEYRPGFFVFLKVEMWYLSCFSHTHKVREMLCLKNTFLHSYPFSCSTESRQNIGLWDARLACLFYWKGTIYFHQMWVNFFAVWLMIKIISSLTLLGQRVFELMCSPRQYAWQPYRELEKLLWEKKVNNSLFLCWNYM